MKILFCIRILLPARARTRDLLRFSRFDIPHWFLRGQRDALALDYYAIRPLVDNSVKLLLLICLLFKTLGIACQVLTRGDTRLLKVYKETS
jgi:hypothetical protein